MTCIVNKQICSLSKYVGIRQFFNFQKSKYDLGTYNIVELGIISPELSIPDYIEKPSYYNHPENKPQPLDPHNVEIKTLADIQQMRASCQLASKILKKCQNIIKPGITTDEIDRFVHNETITAKAYPSPLRYCGFPKSVCTSVNNVACHGIPDDRKLMDGDIIHVDVTVFFQGFHGDCSVTYEVGNVDERGKFLIDLTKRCLDQAIRRCGPKRPMSLIGKFIEQFANDNKLNVLPGFIGHGIGRYFHGPPEVLHYNNNIGGLMEPGMTFTIEPILTLGDRDVEIQEDGWTAMTVDNARTASFEHTILITDSGVEVLTE